MNENIGYITKEKYVSLSLTKKKNNTKRKKKKKLNQLWVQIATRNWINFQSVIDISTINQ